METKALVARNWDDLVFAFRNREYGAYPLRQAYARRLMLGLGISTGVMVILLLALRFGGGTKAIEVDRPVLKGGIVLNDPVVVVPRPRPESARRTETRTRTNTTIQVVTTPVDNAPVTEAPVVSPAPGEGVATSADGLVGDDAGEVVDIPVVNTERKVWDVVEVMPSYEGGISEMMKFIRRKIHYPSSARRIGTEGTVYVSFVVNGDGSVSQVSVLRGISAACDEEAMRVIAMLPGWKGGKQNGNAVAVRMVLPITFSLDR